MNTSIKIGIVVANSLKSGGGFSYANLIMNAISIDKTEGFEFEVFTTVHENLKLIKEMGLKSNYVNTSVKDWVKNVIIRRVFTIGINLNKAAKQKKIDLIYFLGPYSYWREIENNFPFIFTIHDIGYYELSFFPEYSGKEFWRREKIYREGAIRSYKLIVDSEITKKKLIEYFGLPKEKIITKKFATKKHLIKATRKLPRAWGEKKFVIYPAQFWAHKNHIYLIEALALSLEKGLEIHIVLTGGDMGNMRHVRDMVEHRGLSEYIHFFGFVSDRELMGLYEDAIAMVMPTYLSTTNIPPLEAFTKKLPVLYPHDNITGVDEYLRSNTIPLDLNDPKSMYIGLKKIISNSTEICQKVDAAYNQTIKLCEADHLSDLRLVWKEYAKYRKLWG